MSTASATGLDGGRGFFAPFPWRKHLIHGAILSLVILAFKITSYICGTRFSGFSIVSPLFPLTIAGFVFALVVFIRTIWGISLAFAGRIPRNKTSLVALPAAGAVALMALPGFHKAVASEIRKKASREEWIGMARALLDAPPAWLKIPGGSWANEGWLAMTSPLDRLRFSRQPRVSIEADTIHFLWGSPFAHGWGIAISGVSGKEPVLPRDSRDHLAIYPEVWVYNLPD